MSDERRTAAAQRDASRSTARQRAHTVRRAPNCPRWPSRGRPRPRPRVCGQPGKRYRSVYL